MTKQELFILKAKRKGFSIERYLFSFPEFLFKPKPLLLPSAARAAFNNDFKHILNKQQLDYYYPQQCAMKEMFGGKATIKFIN